MKEYFKIKKALENVDRALVTLLNVHGLESVKADLEACASELQSEMLVLEDLMAGDALEEVLVNSDGEEI